ncbi:MAG TPA: four helix bundle protein [Planctomycetota bacterium]
MTSFTNLDVWKVAHEATLELYRAVRGFPEDERFCLSLQMRRAAVSIEANIAEGSAKPTSRERRRFYTFSRGSAEELRCCLIIARDLGYLSNAGGLFEKLDRVCAMLYRLMTPKVAPPQGN